jgi:hypothetical protein
MSMVSPESDLAEARTAARDLSAAVERLSRSYPDTLDLRRLTEDVRRVRADLDLIAGPDPATVSTVGPHDTEYDPRQFGDGTYENARRRGQ